LWHCRTGSGGYQFIITAARTPKCRQPGRPPQLDSTNFGLGQKPHAPGLTIRLEPGRLSNTCRAHFLRTARYAAGLCAEDEAANSAGARPLGRNRVGQLNGNRNQQTSLGVPNLNFHRRRSIDASTAKVHRDQLSHLLSFVEAGQIAALNNDGPLRGPCSSAQPAPLDVRSHKQRRHVVLGTSGPLP